MKRMGSVALLCGALVLTVGTSAFGRWEGAEIIDAGAGNYAGGSQIAFDGSGSAIAVFRQSDGSNWRITANRYTPPWSFPIRFNFQPGWSTIPDGYYSTDGGGYGTHSGPEGNLGYGWID